MLSFLALTVLCHETQIETFNSPGYTFPVAGLWYSAGAATSAMPLGGLGTGFVDLTSAGTFGASTAENNWLQPRQVPAKCGLWIYVNEKKADLFPGSTPLPSLRFWGHYPAADIDFGPMFGDVQVYLRAVAPLIPHDYALSGLPAALFHFLVMNAGAGPAPIEIGLQWEAPAESATKAQGNVEGAIGWRRDLLPPGETWRLAPALAFAADRRKIAENVREINVAAASLKGVEVPEGTAYAFSGVTDFLLDDLGGFDWESRRRESAVFNGRPNIGQILWNLRYEDRKAGRGLEGPYGLKGTGLPTRTADGRIEVRLRVSQAGPDIVALVFTILNLSNSAVRDLRFGLAVNADVGGPDRAENQRAEFDKDLGAIVFEDGAGGAVALAGKPDDFIVSTWPNAHAAMLNNQWAAVEQAPQAPAIETVPDGIQIKGRRGSYAIAGTGPQGWAFQSVRSEETVIRSRAVKTLGPGEKTELTLALAWHFPYWTSSDGETLRHRYAVDYDDAGKVLAATLPRAQEIEDKIAAWQQAVYASPTTPPLLKDALINGLYIWPRNSWWIADGRFFQSESFTGCPITETFVCRFNGSFPLALLFPECERATMRSVAAAQAKSGEIPFGFGSPTGSRSPYFHVQHPIVSPEFVLLTWRNYLLWQDAAYLDDMYPHVQAALRFAMTLDKDGDGLVNEDPGSDKGFPANQYYDIWPWWGSSAYTGSIWLAALRAGEEMAKKKGDTAFADEMRGWYQRASAAFQQKLWTGAYYRLYNDPEKKRVSDTSLTNALCGQWFAYAAGLGDIVPRASVLSVIDAVLRWNVAATPYGAVNGLRPDGRPDETFPDHSAVITIGEVWNFCAMAAFAGRLEDAIRLFNTSYANILVQQRTPWNVPWSLDRTTGAIKWGVNYYSNPCVWTLFQALDPATYADLGKDRIKKP
jgi:uncharacterized protein (DUF608 family)